jgi:fructose/tagatose bisphosphate aldolase
MGRERPATTAIVIHDLEHARAALAAAAAFHRPVILISAPGAAGYAGAAWFLRVVARAAADHPDARWDAVLDCADHAGHVLSALRQGAKVVRYTGTKATAAKLAAIADGSGARVETGRLKAFDLRSEADPRAACWAWIGNAKQGTRNER